MPRKQYLTSPTPQPPDPFTTTLPHLANPKKLPTKGLQRFRVFDVLKLICILGGIERFVRRLILSVLMGRNGVIWKLSPDKPSRKS